MKKIHIKIKRKLVKSRAPIKPTQVHKDKSKYSRTVKHKTTN